MMIVDVTFGCVRFSLAQLDDNDPDGKKYEEYLSLFDEPSHYHIRYPVRYHLDMMELGSAPYPPTGGHTLGHFHICIH